MSDTLSRPVILRLGDNDGPLVPASLGADDPFAARRGIAWSGEAAMAAGRVAWEGGTLTVPAFPHTELLIIQGGALLVEGTTESDAPFTLRLDVGQAAVLPRGAALRLRADSPVSWSFCAAVAPAPALGASAVAVDPDFRSVALAGAGGGSSARPGSGLPQRPCAARHSHRPARRRVGFHPLRAPRRSPPGQRMDAHSRRRGDADRRGRRRAHGGGGRYGVRAARHALRLDQPCFRSQNLRGAGHARLIGRPQHMLPRDWAGRTENSRSAIENSTAYFAENDRMTP